MSQIKMNTTTEKPQRKVMFCKRIFFSFFWIWPPQGNILIMTTTTATIVINVLQIMAIKHIVIIDF